MIGASVAYHLAIRGCANVHVIERGSRPGEGSTGKATGGFRAQFGSDVNVRLSLLSREKLLRFRDETGTDPGFQPYGYLFLAKHRRTLDALTSSFTIQRNAGLTDVRSVSRDEIAKINPAVLQDDIEGGTFSPSDGFLRPLSILRGYLDAAQRLGVRVDYGMPCTGFRLANDRILSVDVPGDSVSADVVVNAAGAWAGLVANRAGVEIPVTPLRRQIAVTGPFDRLPEDMPLTIFADDGFHLRVRDGRVLLLQPDTPDTADPFDTTVNRDWFDQTVRRAREAVPCLREATVRFEDSSAGLYEMSPDGHALLGVAPGVKNLYLANGSSGHGVMHAPALGQLLAEMILEGKATTLDTTPLRPERFAEGRPNIGSVFI